MNTSLLNSFFILVFKMIFNAQPPAIHIGKFEYFLIYGLATSKKHSSNAF